MTTGLGFAGNLRAFYCSQEGRVDGGWWEIATLMAKVVNLLRVRVRVYRTLESLERKSPGEDDH